MRTSRLQRLDGPGVVALVVLEGEVDGSAGMARSIRGRMAATRTLTGVSGKAPGQAALGVTRLARLTGLDRAGVEVAAAVRPGGHVLQVSTGKGETAGQAARSALSEAAELWGAERPLALLHGTAGELTGPLRRPRVVGPGELGWRPARGGPRRARRCGSPGGPATTSSPAAPAWCRPTPSTARRPAASRSGRRSSPGPPTGWPPTPSRAAALLHALLELCERDRARPRLPRGFTPGAVRRRLLDPGLAGAGPRRAPPAWARRARRPAASRVHLLDATRRPRPALRRRAAGRPRGRAGAGGGRLRLPARARRGAAGRAARGGPVAPHRDPRGAGGRAPRRPRGRPAARRAVRRGPPARRAAALPDHRPLPPAGALAARAGPPGRRRPRPRGGLRPRRRRRGSRP